MSSSPLTLLLIYRGMSAIPPQGFDCLPNLVFRLRTQVRRDRDLDNGNVERSLRIWEHDLEGDEDAFVVETSSSVIVAQQRSHLARVGLPWSNPLDTSGLFSLLPSRPLLSDAGEVRACMPFLVNS